jgi:hypothetical protein
MDDEDMFRPEKMMRIVDPYAKKKVDEAETDLHRVYCDESETVRELYWNMVRVCTRCRVEYREKDNLGIWACRMHPGEYNYSVDGDRYSVGRLDCCGRRITHDAQVGVGHRASLGGCYKVDHTDTVGGMQSFVALQLEDVAHANIRIASLGMPDTVHRTDRHRLKKEHTHLHKNMFVRKHQITDKMTLPGVDPMVRIGCPRRAAELVNVEYQAPVIADEYVSYYSDIPDAINDDYVVPFIVVQRYATTFSGGPMRSGSFR